MDPMAKEFKLTLSARQRWDLWLFIFRVGGVKPRDKEQVRNLDAVCEAFGISEIVERFDIAQEENPGGVLKYTDFAERACEVGSVDLKRLIEYLDKMPEEIDNALALRLLRISDMLQDVKDRKLAAVAETG